MRVKADWYTKPSRIKRLPDVRMVKVYQNVSWRQRILLHWCECQLVGPVCGLQCQGCPLLVRIVLFTSWFFMQLQAFLETHCTIPTLYLFAQKTFLVPLLGRQRRPYIVFRHRVCMASYSYILYTSIEARLWRASLLRRSGNGAAVMVVRR